MCLGREILSLLSFQCKKFSARETDWKPSLLLLLSRFSRVRPV